MALSRSFQTIIDFVDTLIHNPGRRYLTDEDYTRAIRQSITIWAGMVKGLRLQVDLTSVAGQRAYILDRAHFKLRGAQYIRNLDVVATEERTELDIITRQDRAFIDMASAPNGAPLNLDLSLAGVQSDKPKYVLHQHESSRILVLDTPAVSGDTIRLFTYSKPTQDLGPGVDWEGEADDVPGIAYGVCMILRLKSRDSGEAMDFKSLQAEHAERVLRSMRQARQVTQMRFGQDRVTRTRSIYGGG